MCLPRVVSLLLWCNEKIFGNLSRECLRSGHWMPRLRFYPAAVLGVAHLSDGNHVESLSTCFLRAGLSPPCRWFFPNAAVGLSSGAAQSGESTLLAIFLLTTGELVLRRSSDLMPIWSSMDFPRFTVTTFIEDCFRYGPVQSDAATDFHEDLPTSGMVV